MVRGVIVMIGVMASASGVTESAGGESGSSDACRVLAHWPRNRASSSPSLLVDPRTLGFVC